MMLRKESFQQYFISHNQTILHPVFGTFRNSFSLQYTRSGEDFRTSGFPYRTTNFTPRMAWILAFGGVDGLKNVNIHKLHFCALQKKLVFCHLAYSKIQISLSSGVRNAFSILPDALCNCSSEDKFLPKVMVNLSACFLLSERACWHSVVESEIKPWGPRPVGR